MRKIPKNLESLHKFAQAYAKLSRTYFCIDKSITALVIEGLARHKDDYGAPLCPCRHYESKKTEVLAAYWNCPCVPMRERKECHCMLFLQPSNEFSGKDQLISKDDLREYLS